jgi:hypothetical protein
VAIHLAQLKGIKEPDVAGAVALLKHTWQARHALTDNGRSYFCMSLA